MADMMDAGNAIRDALAAALYPQGTAAPSAVGVDCTVYVGWPVPQVLQAALAAGAVQVTVFPLQRERNTTRYQQDWEVVSAPVPVLVATLAGNVVTLGGLAAAGDVLGVVVQGRLYSYVLTAEDSLASAAAALLALLQVDYPAAVADGAVITLPDSAAVQKVLVGASGTVLREIRRQERDFQVTVWAPTPALRDAVARRIDPVLSAAEFLPLADGSAMRIVYRRSHLNDGNEQVVLYRRDFIYKVEFALYQRASASPILRSLAEVACP